MSSIAHPTEAELEERFHRLATQWKEENVLISSVTQLVLLRSYQRIIGMGPVAIPWLLRELATEPDYWFWALEAITGENPVVEKDRGDLQAMTKAWLAWGRENGYAC